MIGIISLLLTLLSGSLVTIHQKVKAVHCRSGLRQWGQATHLSVADNDDWLPQDGSSNGRSIKGGWYVSLPPYLNLPSYGNWQGRTNIHFRPPPSPYLCPGNKRLSDGLNLFHYSLNRHVNGAGVGNRVMLSSIRRPSTVIWLFDNGKKAAVASSSNLHTNIHLEIPNILCLDGHVEGSPVRDLVMKNKANGAIAPMVKGLQWMP